MKVYCFPRTPLEVDVLKWDACNLPLRDQCVDVFITDLVRMSNRMGYNRYTFMLSHGGLNMICSQTDEIFDYTHMKRFEKTVLCCDS